MVFTMLKAPNSIPPGLIEAIEAAGHSVSRGPDGWQCSNDAAVQALIDGYAASAERLAFHQGQKRGELDAVFAAKIAAGLSYQGKVFQIDNASRANIAAMATFALSGGTWPKDFYWIAADNTHLLMTAQDILTFGQAAGTYVSAMVLTNRALKDAIAAAVSVQDVEAIDLAANWPR